MIIRNHQAVRYLQFPHLGRFAELWHGVFTRTGGFSGGPFGQLNVGNGLGDSRETVRRNRELLAAVSGGRTFVFLNQTHGTTVQVLAATDGDGQGGLNGDAVVSDRPGRMLTIQAADCQAVLLYDPRRRVVANVHSGWRGSVANIIGRVVDTMRTRFDCRGADILAAVGPSLGPCCAEFVNFHEELPRELWPYRHGRCHFDFWAISRDQLEASGVPRENVVTSDMCTRCNPALFYSYRGEGLTGRFAAVIGLK